jgi:hypothetical protein
MVVKAMSQNFLLGSTMQLVIDMLTGNAVISIHQHLFKEIVWSVSIWLLLAWLG